jgi:hypothetical protein
MLLFTHAVHRGCTAVASLAHHSALDFIQVPLDLECHETLALVGIPSFCIAKQSSHELALPGELLAHGRVRDRVWPYPPPLVRRGREARPVPLGSPRSTQRVAHESPPDATSARHRPNFAQHSQDRWSAWAAVHAGNRGPGKLGARPKRPRKTAQKGRLQFA